MVGQEDLAKRVPVLGMSCVDWRAKGRPWRLVKREAEARGKGSRGGQRLGVLWEREGKGRAEAREKKGDAFGIVEGSEERGGGGRKWGMSWSDVGIR